MAGALLWALQARDPQRCAQLVAPLNVKILELLLPEVRQGAGELARALCTSVGSRLWLVAVDKSWDCRVVCCCCHLTRTTMLHGWN